MVREIRFRDLDARETSRWVQALGEPPLLEAPARSLDPLWCLVGGGVTALVGALSNTMRLVPDPLSDLVLHMLRVGVCVAVIACFVQLAWRARRLSRARFPVGCYLYRWGYAEVSLRGVRFVSGPLLATRVEIGPPRISGASLIRIELRTDDGWSRAFRLIGTELDVPDLEALATPRLEASDAYRDPPRRALEGARARWAASPAFEVFVLSVLAGLVGSVAPVVSAWEHARRDVADLQSRTHIASFDYERASDVARAYPYFDWVGEATRLARHDVLAQTRARIEGDLRPPYRDAMLGLLDDVHPSVYVFHECYFGEPEASLLARFAEAHGVTDLSYTRAFTGANPFLDHYFDFDQPWQHWREARLEMRSDCRLEPLSMIEATPPRVAFRVQLEWSLLLDHEVVAHRAVTLEPDVIAEVAACAQAGRDPAAAQLHAAAGLVSLVVHQDVYESGRGYWTSSVILADFEELIPCVSRGVRSLRIERD